MTVESLCTYVLLAGLPGTGKSTLAQNLAQRLSSRGLSSVILNKDEVRTAVFPGDATDYSDAQNDLCMEMLLQAAHYLRCKAQPPRFIFFDGRTFSQAAQIKSVIAAAEAEASTWRILHLVCPPDMAEDRLARASSHPAANRSFALYRELQSHFEPLQQPHLMIDTAEPLEDSLQKALQYIGAAQTEPQL